VAPGAIQACNDNIRITGDTITKIGDSAIGITLLGALTRSLISGNVIVNVKSYAIHGKGTGLTPPSAPGRAPPSNLIAHYDASACFG